MTLRLGNRRRAHHLLALAWLGAGCGCAGPEASLPTVEVQPRGRDGEVRL